MTRKLPRFLLPDVLLWPLQASGLDELTKRVAFAASILYAIGIAILNLSLFSWGIPGLTPLRTTAIPIGICCVLANGILLLPFLAVRSFSKLSSGVGPEYLNSYAWIFAFVLDTCLLRLLMWETYNKTTWGFEEGNWWMSAGIAGSALLPLVSIPIWRVDNFKRSFLSVALSVASLVVFFCFYFQYLYPMIPLWAGGGRVETVRFFVKTEAKNSLESVGVQVTPEGVTGPVKVIQETDNSVFLVGTRTVDGPKTDPHKSISTDYRLPVSLGRDQILAVAYKPIGWSEPSYENNQCWTKQAMTQDCH